MSASRPKESPTASRKYFALGHLFVYLAVCFVFAGNWLLRLGDGQTGLLLAICIVLCCAGLSAGVVGGFRPVVTVFFVFHLCWYVLPAGYQILVGHGAWGDASVFNDPAVTNAAIGVVALGLASMLAGYLYGMHKPRIGEERTGRGADAPGLGKILVVGTTATILLPLVMSVSGGFGGLFVSRVAAAEQLARAGLTIEQSGGGVFGLLRIVPGALALVFLLLILQRIRVRRAVGERDNRDITLFVWAAALVVLYLNPFANARYTVVTALAAAMLVWFVPRASRSGTMATAGGALGLLFAYPLANVFRYTTRSSDNQLSYGLESLTTPDFDGVQQSVNSMAFVARHGHTWGDQVISALFLVVPRSVWSGKSEPTNVLVARDRGYLFTNLSLPVESELFIDLGIVGLVVVMVGWGLVAARLDHDWLSGRGSVTLTAFVALAQVGFVRGPISGAIGFAGLGIAVLIWVNWAAVTRRVASRSSQPFGQDPPSRSRDGSHDDGS